MFWNYQPRRCEPENIVLSFDPQQGKYLKSYPLHETQQVLIDNENEVQIGLSVYLTHDLVMEVLSYGERVKVVAPQELKDEVARSYSEALKQY
ncbi:MAG TPA: WYL domain-containing protein [Daejeonella sp.]